MAGKAKHPLPLYSKHQLSVMWGMAPRTVNIRLKGVPPAESVDRGTRVEQKYDVPAAARYLNDDVAGDRSNIYDLNVERARHEHLKANEKEIVVATLRGDRVKREDIQDDILSSDAIMKQALDALPGRLADPIARATGSDVGMVRGLLLIEVRKIESAIAAGFQGLADRYAGGVEDDIGGEGGPVDAG